MKAATTASSAYLNLFMFFMLVLVLASNFLLLFVGWEGVGLCSYLLIGFYFHENFANDAGKKAFIVNRIGDFGFMLGMLLLVVTFHTLDFGQLSSAVASMPVETSLGVLTLITLLLFVGATGKSAQFPLYVWLPDAMAGPTPVSALIHAATMVTAGVYMIARVVVSLRSYAAGAACCRVDRTIHGGVCRDHRPCAKRYQESVRVFNRVATRIHVSGLRRRRVFHRHLPCDDARVFQSPALSGRGQRNSRHLR